MAVQRARFVWRGEEAKAKLREGTVRGLGIAMEHLLETSRQQVPNLEGTLERSGRATVDAGQLVGAVSYDTEYAVPQHERLDYHHPGGRKAKYLEDPMNSEGDTILALVATEQRRSLR